MSLGILFNTPYYEGGAVVPQTGPQHHVALAGHPFMLDRTPQFGGLRHQSVPLVRDQADTSDAVGEQTLNPKGFFRRAGESWHLGAGQGTFDRPGGSAWRFNASKGLNPWEQWSLSLLPRVDRIVKSTATNLRMAVAGTHLYFVDGTALKYTTDLAETAARTTVTGTPATAALSITSDGYNVWTAHGTDGLYLTTRGAATTASHVTGTVLVCEYVKDRLMVAGGPNSKAVYNITASGALPTALFDHPNTDFRWVGFAEGVSHIYAAGWAGDKSIIYRTKIKEDGTGLDAMVVAGRLPDGEVITSITGYLGFIVLGSDKGVRFATVSDTGNLEIGAFIPVGTGSVKAFEGQDRFAWFGWPSFDSVDSGLGRLDLQNFSDVERLAPAYASDLMPSVGYISFGGAAQLNSFTDDHADLDATVDLDIRVHVKVDDWTPSTEGTFICKGAQLITFAYKVGIEATTGKMLLSYSANGSSWVDNVSTVATGLADGSEKWLGYTMDGDDGGGNRVLKFYVSDYPFADINSWTQVGTTVTTAGTASIFNSGVQLIVGTFPFTSNGLSGRIYEVQVRNGINGTIVANPRWRDAKPGKATIKDSTGKVWNNNNTSITQQQTLGDVLSIVTFAGRQVFSISGQGIYVGHATEVVPTGHLDTGRITYNLSENKALLQVDGILLTHHDDSTHSVDVSVDGDDFESLGEHVHHLEPFFTSDVAGHDFELRWHLDRSESDFTEGTELHSWLTKAQPMVPATNLITAPLLLAPEYEAASGIPVQMDPNAEHEFIAGLCSSREIVPWQEGTRSYSVIVDDYDLYVEDVYVRTDGLLGFNGTLTVRMKEV